MEALRHIWDEAYFLPKPPLTTLPDQRGRVFIVTGGYGGVGLELSKILYRHNGTVYIAGRSESKGKTAISTIKNDSPNSSGRLVFLHIDLSDLTTVKPAAESFLRQETRLDVLTNNAAVMGPPIGSKGAQGHELQLVTNVLGPFLFSKLLTPLLQRTAAEAPPGSVRVTWASSVGINAYSPINGVTFAASGAPTDHEPHLVNYGQTKAANYFLASQYTKHHPYASSKIISNVWNPGNLNSELARHIKGFSQWLITKLMLYPPVYGAYTELYAGWSDEAGREERNGRYILPWGRFGSVRRDVEASLADGGAAGVMWEWCEKETKNLKSLTTSSHCKLLGASFKLPLLPQRIFKQYWRDPSPLYGKLFVSVMVGGFTFYYLGKLKPGYAVIITIPPAIVNAVVPKFYTVISNVLPFFFTMVSRFNGVVQP